MLNFVVRIDCRYPIRDDQTAIGARIVRQSPPKRYLDLAGRAAWAGHGGESIRILDATINDTFIRVDLPANRIYRAVKSRARLKRLAQVDVDCHVDPPRGWRDTVALLCRGLQLNSARADHPALSIIRKTHAARHSRA